MVDFVVRQIPAENPDDEQWERDPYDEYRWVGAVKDADTYVWQVEFAMCEVPLDGELRAEVHGAIDAALRAVPGVERVLREDQEVWMVIGPAATGQDLMRAAGTVADTYADRVRTYGASLA